MASMKEIAKRCNVSIGTVSKAMNGYTDIGQETRNNILKVATEMGYLPNSSTRSLKARRSYNLGVLFVDEAMNGLTHDYFNHVLDSFKRTAEKKGYDLTFASGNISGQKMTYYEHCRYRGVDGIVLACVDFYTEEILEIIRSDIPIVTIDHVYDGKTAVVSNNTQGMEQLINYVCSMGHKKIAYIHGEPDSSVTKARLAGYYRTLKSNRIEAKDEYVKSGLYRDADISASRTRELLEMSDPPTCILYPDDYAALGGINVIRDKGLRIPEDISIVGYDGIMAARILEPKLTTLCQDTRKIGIVAAEQLIEQIENPKMAISDKFTVNGTLFVGASVKNIR